MKKNYRLLKIQPINFTKINIKKIYESPHYKQTKYQLKTFFSQQARRIKSTIYDLK